MPLKRNMILLAAYVAALVLMTLPFAQIEAKGPPATFGELGLMSVK